MPNAQWPMSKEGRMNKSRSLVPRVPLWSLVIGHWKLEIGHLPFAILPLLLALPTLAAPKPVDLTIFPPEIRLSTKNDRQSIVVQASYADGTTRDVTAQASLSFANKKLTRLDKATLYPLANGQTELTVKFEGRTL